MKRILSFYPGLFALAALGFGLFGSGATRAAPEARNLAALHVASDPVGAACTLNGLARGVTPVTIDGLAPGEYLVVLTKAGFREFRRTVSLQPGGREAVDAALEPERGMALIRTVPELSRVTIDGADRGLAPLVLTDLPLGTHRVHVEASGFLPRDVELEVDARKPVKLIVDLATSTATLDIQSDPPAANVTLDGEARGSTPLLLERVPSGSHNLRVELNGYAPYAQTLTASAGQRHAVNAALTALPARLQVVSIPPGARIYLDNTFKGIAPVTISGLPAGEYRIRTELRGFTIDSRAVTLTFGADDTQEIRLESNSGTLELVTEPSGVTVFIDGQSVGLTAFGTNSTDQVSSPLLVKLIETGSHTLQLTRQGYYSIKKTINVTKDETVTLHEALKRRFIPNYEVTTPTGTTAGVLVAVEPNGDVRLEVRPGVIKTIFARDVRAGRPMKEQPLPDIEE